MSLDTTGQSEIDRFEVLVGMPLAKFEQRWRGVMLGLRGRMLAQASRCWALIFQSHSIAASNRAVICPSRVSSAIFCPCMSVT